MSTYLDDARSALAMVKEAGRSLPISRTTATTDPVAGSVTAVETAGNIEAVVLPGNSTGIQALLGSGDTEVDKKFTVEKRRYVLAAALGAPFEPDVNDVLTFDGVKWRVYACTPLSPAGIPILFKMGVGRV